MQSGDSATFRPGVAAAALTDVGMRRTTNQDSHSLLLADNRDQWLERGHLLLVADGMGAHAAGELASKMAAEGISHRYMKYRELSPPEALKKAIEETNSEIHRRGEANAEFHQMGTTTSAIVLLPQGALAAHVGDSRVYRIRGARIDQITFDHSLQWELQASGQLTPGSDAAAAVPKNVITRSLGPSANVQIDLEGPLPIELGDKYLLCSDGLTGRVEDPEIGGIVASLPVQEAARLLIDLANLRGGPDNITCLIADVQAPEVTTAAAQAAPIRIGAVKKVGAIHPVTMVVLGVAALAAVVLLMINLIAAAGAAIVAAVAGITALVQRQGSSSGGRVLGGGLRLGKGPYVAASAAPSAELVQSLKEVADKLRKAAKDNAWEVDWIRFDTHCQSAATAAKQGQLTAAVREYGRGVIFMMEQLRNQSTADDSWVQY